MAPKEARLAPAYFACTLPMLLIFKVLHRSKHARNLKIDRRHAIVTPEGVIDAIRARQQRAGDAAEGHRPGVHRRPFVEFITTSIICCWRRESGRRAKVAST
jgi:hypothetical protein